MLNSPVFFLVSCNVRVLKNILVPLENFGKVLFAQKVLNFPFRVENFRKQRLEIAFSNGKECLAAPAAKDTLIHRQRHS